jgi:hypothetical protein
MHELGFVEMIETWWRAKRVEGSATIKFASKLVDLHKMLKEYGVVISMLRQQSCLEALEKIKAWI